MYYKRHPQNYCVDMRGNSLIMMSCSILKIPYSSFQGIVMSCLVLKALCSNTDYDMLVLTRLSTFSHIIMYRVLHFSGLFSVLSFVPGLSSEG